MPAAAGGASSISGSWRAALGDPDLDYWLNVFGIQRLEFVLANFTDASLTWRRPARLQAAARRKKVDSTNEGES